MDDIIKDLPTFPGWEVGSLLFWFFLMPGFILGEKGKQERIFTEEGEWIPVTEINVSPCYLVDIKTKEKDGYEAIKVAFGEAKRQKKPVLGELEKAGVKQPVRYIREFRLERFLSLMPDFKILTGEKPGIEYKGKKIFVGERISPTFFFEKGEFVDVSGTSKGKGFQGVVKRHGFAGGPRTHGQSDRERAPGSIGQTTTPGRVYKGKRMAGRMGGERVTIQNLEVIEVEDKVLKIKGQVPGAPKGLLEIRPAIKVLRRETREKHVH